MMLCGGGGLLHCPFVGLNKKEQSHKTIVRPVAVRRAEMSTRDTSIITPEPKDADHHLQEMKYI